jgi:hypothetical protein
VRKLQHPFRDGQEDNPKAIVAKKQRSAPTLTEHGARFETKHKPCRDGSDFDVRAHASATPSGSADRKIDVAPEEAAS